jgi:hypothetical protein
MLDYVLRGLILDHFGFHRLQLPEYLYEVLARIGAFRTEGDANLDRMIDTCLDWLNPWPNRLRRTDEHQYAIMGSVCFTSSARCTYGAMDLSSTGTMGRPRGMLQGVASPPVRPPCPLSLHTKKLETSCFEHKC